VISKRQLVIWAGYDPSILQRVEYFDQEQGHVTGYSAGLTRMRQVDG
jgi:hypothetical protein